MKTSTKKLISVVRQLGLGVGLGVTSTGLAPVTLLALAVSRNLMKAEGGGPSAVKYKICRDDYCAHCQQCIKRDGWGRDFVKNTLVDGQMHGI